MYEPGEQLAAAREQAGLTQAALGRAIGRDQSTVSYYETGQIMLPPEERIEALARALGRPLDEVRGWWGLPPAGKPEPTALGEFVARLGLDRDAEQRHEELRGALGPAGYSRLVALLLARHRAELDLLRLVAQAGTSP